MSILNNLIPSLSRTTLKAICGELGLADDGREKQLLVDRILGANGATASDPVLPSAPVPRGPPPKVESDDVYLANALRNETILEQQEPLYGVFREFYRDARIKQLQPDAWETWFHEADTLWHTTTQPTLMSA